MPELGNEALEWIVKLSKVLRLIIRSAIKTTEESVEEAVTVLVV